MQVCGPLFMRVFMNGSLRELKGVGEKTEKLFEKIGVRSMEDLLRYYPRDYEEFKEPVRVSEVRENEVCSVEGVVSSGVYVNRVRSLQVVGTSVSDESGKLSMVWFNVPYMRSTLKKGSRFVFRGRVTRKNGKLQMEHP